MSAGSRRITGVASGRVNQLLPVLAGPASAAIGEIPSGGVHAHKLRRALDLHVRAENRRPRSFWQCRRDRDRTRSKEWCPSKCLAAFRVPDRAPRASVVMLCRRPPEYQVPRRDGSLFGPPVALPCPLVARPSVATPTWRLRALGGDYSRRIIPTSCTMTPHAVRAPHNSWRGRVPQGHLGFARRSRPESEARPPPSADQGVSVFASASIAPRNL